MQYILTKVDIMNNKVILTTPFVLKEDKFRVDCTRFVQNYFFRVGSGSDFSLVTDSDPGHDPLFYTIIIIYSDL